MNKTYELIFSLGIHGSVRNIFLHFFDPTRQMAFGCSVFARAHERRSFFSAAVHSIAGVAGWTVRPHKAYNHRNPAIGFARIFSLVRSTPKQPKRTAARLDLLFFLQKNRRFTKAFSSRENCKMRYNSHQTVKLSTHCLSCTAHPCIQRLNKDCDR
jgi:hypothetical protein